MRKTSIQTRIVIPIVLTMVFVFGLAALVASRLVAQTVERQVKTRISGLAEFISRAGFPLSERTLRSMGELLDVGLATVTTDGKVGESNLHAGLAEALEQSSRKTGLKKEAPFIFSLRFEEQEYLVASTPVSSRENVTLLLLYDSVRLRKAQWDSVWPIIVSAIVAVILANISGWYVAKSITRPLRKLAQSTAQVASGDLSAGIPIETGDEIEQLSMDFDHMVRSLREYQDELIRKERLATLGAVAAGIAHEIRNPLTSMKMTAQMLLDEKGTRDRESLELMLNEIKRLQLATGGLLDYARPGSHKPGSASSVKEVKEVIELLDRQLRHHGIEIITRFPGKELKVAINPNRLKQVTMNIVLNAINAMPEGGSLEIALKTENDEATFKFTDSGEGIPDAEIEKIFEPFYSKGTGGSGLGLAISKRFVEESDGSISVESAENGTTFTIKLPADTGENEKNA